MSDNSTFICVCIPVYNGAKTIELTLDSITAQSHTNFEILVCDNLSTDNTLEIVNKFKESAKVKIDCITNPNKGTAEDNWNYMLSKLTTNAEFISIYHADDIYAKSILAEQLAFIQQSKLMACFTLCTLIDGQGNDISAKRNYNYQLPFEIGNVGLRFEDIFKHILRYRNFLITPTLLFRKELLTSIVPFFDNKKSKSSSDLDTWLRISKLYPIGILQKPLLNYRISESQGSFLLKAGRTTPADFFQVIDNHLAELDDRSIYRKELKFYNLLKSNDMTICSVNLLRQGKTTEAKIILKQATKLSNAIIFKQLKYFKMFIFRTFTATLLAYKFEKVAIFIAKKIHL